MDAEHKLIMAHLETIASDNKEIKKLAKSTNGRVTVLELKWAEFGGFIKGVKAWPVLLLAIGTGGGYALRYFVG